MTSDSSWEWVEPEDFFCTHVADQPRAFWLDGSGARPWSGRLSCIGWLEPDEVSLTQYAASSAVARHTAAAVREVGTDMFVELQRHSGPARPPPSPHRWVGFFGYGARRDLPVELDDDPEALDSCWLRVRRFAAFDHARRRVRVVAAPGEIVRWKDEVAQLLRTTRPAPELESPVPASLVSTTSPSEFAHAFDRVQRELRAGNSYETNLTFRTVVASHSPPLDTYRRLRRLSPTPYAAFITHNGTSVLSSSPERFATITADRRIETRPIKGTTARDPDPQLDAAAAQRLRDEPKFLGENLMIVDLLRNDMSQVCEVGTVDVTNLMHVESYPAVHQLVTTIRGRLRDDVTSMEALRALFPGGSMTGAPKYRTMQIIADVESSPRGVYSGAIGWLLDDGSADLGIVIRTLVHRNGRYVLGTGGGITVHSQCDDEYAETTWKAANLHRALGL